MVKLKGGVVLKGVIYDNSGILIRINFKIKEVLTCMF
jgi:hypothetical protein